MLMAITAVLLLGLCVRVLRIDTAELWLDEACTAAFADMSQSDLFHALLTTEGHPPIYYELMMAWRAIGDSSALWLRLPSLIAGLALIIATFQIARRLLGDQNAWLPALAAAVSPIGIYYSIEARQYALLAALAAFAWLNLEHYLRSGERRPAIASIIFTGLSCGTHFIALFIVPLPLLWWLLSDPWSKVIQQRAIRIQLGWAAAAMPVLTLALLRLDAGNPGTAWLTSQPVHTALWDSLVALSGSGQYPDYLGFLGLVDVAAPIRWVGLSITGIGLIAGFWPGENGYLRAGAMAWLLPTMVFPAIISLLKPIYLPGRYELAAIPVLYAIWVYGWSRITSRWHSPLRSMVIATLILLSALPTLWEYLPMKVSQPWSSVVAQSRLPAEAPVVCTGLTCPTLRWALTRSGHKASVRGYPSDVEEHPCWESATPLKGERLTHDANLLATALNTAASTVAIAGEFVPGTTRPMHWQTISPLFQRLEQLGFRSQKPDVVQGRWIMRWVK